jgi:hypothetical protein
MPLFEKEYGIVKPFLQKIVVVGSLLSILAASAAAQVLYSANGWESTGTPMFTIGSLIPQDGWVEYETGVDRQFHRITGSTLLGSQTITPRTGTQMHRSISSTDESNYFVWKDLGAAYAARTAGNNTVMVTTDIFMPSADSTSDHEHGIMCYDATGAILLGGFTVINDTRSLFLYGGGRIGGIGGGGVSIPNLVPRDAWTRVALLLDYDNGTEGMVEAYINGHQVTFDLESDPTFRTGWPLTVLSPAAAFNDADLASFPFSNPNASNLFTDNYRVAAVRSISFNGLISLQDVPNIDDALSPVFVTFELRDSAGNSRTGHLALRQLEPTGSNPVRGAYSVRFHDVPDGNYKLYIKGMRHLSRVVNVTVSGSGTVTVPTATLKGGDANGDDSCDVLDLDVLIQSFDRTEGEAGFRPNADFNYDDFVDVLDLDILIRNFDNVGEGF